MCILSSRVPLGTVEKSDWVSLLSLGHSDPLGRRLVTLRLHSDDKEESFEMVFASLRELRKMGTVDAMLPSPLSFAQRRPGPWWSSRPVSPPP